MWQSIAAKKTASLWRREEEEDEKEDDLLKEKQEEEEPEKKGEACSDARNNADGVAKESKKLAATISAKKKASGSHVAVGVP